ncbi:MAG TPA: hypothetical protein VK557_12605 [Pyrinomonadaceae bacterium]|nr:hypothetical protein [Pyrinomonadaceae bacterium]
MLTLRQFKDMPLQIQNVRNLQSANWSTDLEIELKNVSSKPIYFVLAYLDFPNHSTPSGIWFEFGSRSNIQVQRLAKADDPHIDPGQTLVLRIAEQFWAGLRIQDQNSPEMFRKLDLHLGVVSFGDRTGFEVERASDYRSNPPPVEEVVEPIEQRRPSRSLNNKIPDKVPIKVTIRPEIEKAFNDLDNQNWLRDFEIEITNTSDKPIYFLEFWLTMRDPMDRQGGFWLRYGSC